MTTLAEDTKQLDFRDIHEHPPVDPSPVVPDPSWDAQKVYFNEFDSPHKAKGDAFDDFFQQQRTVTDSDLAIQLLERQQQQIQDGASASVADMVDDRLDPLGWPIEQELGERESLTVNVAYPTTDDEDDDADLLGKKNNAAEDNPSGLLVDDVCTSASIMFCGKTVDNEEVNASEEAKIVTKKERIRMYETIRPDEDSSVDEPEDDEESSDDDEEVNKYVEQRNHDDDGDDNGSYSAAAEWEVAKFELDQSALATFTVDSTPVDDESPSEKEKATTKRLFPKMKMRRSGTESEAAPKKNGTSMLLKPPPKEKLQQWEAAKARHGNP